MPVTAIAPPVESIDALASGLSSYLNRDQINGIRRAYYYAEQAHEGQFRRSGEPYVTHPLAVAGILCEMHMDPQSLMAAMAAAGDGCGVLREGVLVVRGCVGDAE